MAGNEEHISGMRPPDHGRNTITEGLAMAAGIGVILMVCAAGIGVIEGSEADSDLISTLFVGGIALFVLGLGGWLAVVRPWENFDDINVPIDGGHSHHDDEADSAAH